MTRKEYSLISTAWAKARLACGVIDAENFNGSKEDFLTRSTLEIYRLLDMLVVEHLDLGSERINEN